MRIAIINFSGRRVGGIETYLSTIIPELTGAGHEIAFWHELDGPADREQIALNKESPRWCAAELGADNALRELMRWSPEIIYSHGLLDPRLEAATLKIAPGVFFAHAYYGTCISGSKTWSSPTIRPCHRAFGPLCFVHYFPHRCGGLNPLTMVREYRRQERRFALLQCYRYVLTGSEHMRAEYANNGVNALHLPLLVQNGQDSAVRPESSERWKILFLGRMDRLKGGMSMIDSLPKIKESVSRPLHVTFAGDGPERELWASHAAHVQAACEGISFEFPGWVTGEAQDALLAKSDLLVMPSLWPEPFGLVGPQAGLRGVPAVAFAVGGISDWLKDDINGYLAPADPPSPDGLAEAVIKCLRNPASYLRLRRGAVTIAKSFSVRNHVSRLMDIFNEAITPDCRQSRQQLI